MHGIQSIRVLSLTCSYFYRFAKKLFLFRAMICSYSPILILILRCVSFSLKCNWIVINTIIHRPHAFLFLFIHICFFYRVHVFYGKEHFAQSGRCSRAITNRVKICSNWAHLSCPMITILITSIIFSLESAKWSTLGCNGCREIEKTANKWQRHTVQAPTAVSILKESDKTASPTKQNREKRTNSIHKLLLFGLARCYGTWKKARTTRRSLHICFLYAI